MRNLNERLTSQILTVISVGGVVLAVYGFLVADIWLAPTQWLLVSAVSGQGLDAALNRVRLYRLRLLGGLLFRR